MTRLVVGRASRWLPRGEHARAMVERLSSKALGREFPEGLEMELVRTCDEVRAIYTRKIE